MRRAGAALALCASLVLAMSPIPSLAGPWSAPEGVTKASELVARWGATDGRQACWNAPDIGFLSAEALNAWAGIDSAQTMSQAAERLLAAWNRHGGERGGPPLHALLFDQGDIALVIEPIDPNALSGLATPCAAAMLPKDANRGQHQPALGKL